MDILNKQEHAFVSGINSAIDELPTATPREPSLQHLAANRMIHLKDARKRVAAIPPTHRFILLDQPTFSRWFKVCALGGAEWKEDVEASAKQLVKEKRIFLLKEAETIDQLLSSLFTRALYHQMPPGSSPRAIDRIISLYRNASGPLHKTEMLTKRAARGALHKLSQILSNGSARGLIVFFLMTRILWYTILTIQFIQTKVIPRLPTWTPPPLARKFGLFLQKNIGFIFFGLMITYMYGGPRVRHLSYRLLRWVRPLDLYMLSLRAMILLAPTIDGALKETAVRLQRTLRAASKRQAVNEVKAAHQLYLDLSKKAFGYPEA